MESEHVLVEVYDNKNKHYGLFENKDTAMKYIYKRLKEQGVKVYYTRITFLDDEGEHIWTDYGSHTHFFYIRRWKPERRIQHV